MGKVEGDGEKEVVCMYLWEVRGVGVLRGGGVG